jgi:hypothetical protein
MKDDLKVERVGLEINLNNGLGDRTFALDDVPEN